MSGRDTVRRKPRARAAEAESNRTETRAGKTTQARKLSPGKPYLPRYEPRGCGRPKAEMETNATDTAQSGQPSLNENPSFENPSFWRKWVVGDRQFYRAVCALMLPIVIQAAVGNFVGLLDDLMIGQIGTAPMSGVAIVGQLIQVFFICVLGATAAPNIFSAQFYGARDGDGVRSAFRFKLAEVLLLTVLALAVLGGFGTRLIRLYLTDGGADAEVALRCAREYLGVMLWGLPPLGLKLAYTGTLRSVGETRMPMIAGVAAVLTNLLGNYVWIFGHFGAPALGVRGAALATVISRCVELIIVAGYAHRHIDRFPFLRGAYRSLRVPSALARPMAIKTAPLLGNEALWALGTAMQMQSYSLRGYSVIAALNIAGAISNLFTVVAMAFGEATSIVVGQQLGAGELERGKQTAWKLAVFSAACCAVIGGVQFALSGAIPQLYNTEPQVRALATQCIRILALCMPAVSFANCCYYALRSGGRMGVTFLYDCGVMWALTVPLAYGLTRLTDWPVASVYMAVQAVFFVKCALGAALLKRGAWAVNLVGKSSGFQ